MVMLNPKSDACRHKAFSRESNFNWSLQLHLQFSCHVIFSLPVNVCRQLSYVKERCEGEPEGHGLSALTTEERTRWAKVRVEISW